MRCSTTSMPTRGGWLTSAPACPGISLCQEAQRWGCVKCKLVDSANHRIGRHRALAGGRCNQGEFVIHALLADGDGATISLAVQGV